MKKRHLTYVFNCFVFLQIFNQINCRKVGGNEINVFDNFFKNKYFLLVIISEVAIQVSTTQFSLLSEFTKQSKLNRGELGGCIAVGSTALLFSVFVKTVFSEKATDKIYGFASRFIDETKDKTSGNKFLDTFNKVNEMKVGDDEEAQSSAQKKGDFEQAV